MCAKVQCSPHIFLLEMKDLQVHGSVISGLYLEPTKDKAILKLFSGEMTEKLKLLTVHKSETPKCAKY